jgi:hypothetical protein
MSFGVILDGRIFPEASRRSSTSCSVLLDDYEMRKYTAIRHTSIFAIKQVAQQKSYCLGSCLAPVPPIYSSSPVQQQKKG